MDIRKKRMVGAVVVILFVAAAITIGLVGFSSFNRIHFNVNDLKEYLLSFGSWSIVALLLIFSVKPLLVVTPIAVLAIAAGLLYGPVYGTVYTMIGAFLSATSGFYIAKYLSNTFIGKRMGKKSAKIEGDIEKHGFSVMLFLRLSMIFPYDPLSYAAGLSSMKYKPFLAGTLIGVIPEMIAYNFIGTSMEDFFSWKTLVAGVILLLFAAITLYFRVRKPKV